MANHKSALKRVRQSEKRRLANKMVKTKVKNAVKSVREAAEEKQPEAALQALQAAIPTIAKAGAKGVIHPRNASRKIARLSKQVTGLKSA